MGSCTICPSPKSLESSRRIVDSPVLGFGLIVSHSISGRLITYLPSNMCSLFECLIVLIDSRSSCIYSLVLQNWGDLMNASIVVSFVPCILMVTQIISQLLLKSVLWVPIRSDCNAIRTPPLELSKFLSLRMTE